MEPIHIANAELVSCHRLRGEPTPLRLTIHTSVDTPDGGAWENEGGAPAPDPEEIVDLWRYRARVKPGLPRKQKAARAYVPINTITVIPLEKSLLGAITRVFQSQKETK